MGQTLLASRETLVNASAEGDLIDNLTVVNEEITASNGLAYFTDMTRLNLLLKPQNIFRHAAKPRNNLRLLARS